MIRTTLRAQAAALVAAFLLWASPSWAQAVLQGGPVSALGGHVPTYLPSGQGGLATVMDSGGAGGGQIGFGLSEKGLQARTPPGQGTGPFGTHDCDWDTYATDPAGAHFLCFDPNVGGNSIIASSLPLQFNIGGQIVPFPAAQIASNLYVAATGADGANSCGSQATPCLTLSHAVAVAANSRFGSSSNNVQINISAGTFAGATIAGNFQNASAVSEHPCIFIVGAGDITSGTPTHIANDGSANYDILISGNACVNVKGIDLPAVSGGGGIFVQDPGTHLIVSGNVSCTGPTGGATEAQYCIHTEGGALTEPTGSGSPQLTVQNKFAWIFTVGATPASMEFDLASGSPLGSISCGSGLTLDPTGGSFLLSASHVNFGWSWNTNCNGIAGHPVVAQYGATFVNASGDDPPNTGSFRIFDTSHYFPDPGMGISSCTGGGGSGTIHAGSTVNVGQIDFIGLSVGVPSCTLRFGVPGAAASYFSNPPFCVVQEIEGTIPATKFANAFNVTTTTFSVAPNSAWGSTESFVYNCQPGNAG